MGYAIAAAAITAIGAGVSASGASKNAKAQKKAQKKIAREETAFAEKWNTNLQGLISEKEDKLYNLGDIFERFESTGAFGDTETLENLRQAQQDFSALAAGDFTAFSSQLRKSMSDALVSTVGSGAPIGAYAQLAADTQMNYRLQGVQTSTGLSEFFSNQANNLLGLEFGVMDQEFNVGYGIDRNRQSAINAARLGQAAQEGVSQAAWGQTIQTVGSSLGSLGMYFDNSRRLDDLLALQRQQISAMGASASSGSVPQVQPLNLSNISIPTYSGSTPSYARGSSVPDPYDPSRFNTIPTLPGDPTPVNQPLVLPPITETSQASSSPSMLSQVGNVYNPFGLLSYIGQRIATSSSR